MDNRPVGIFDSGVGGLTVTTEIMKELPMEKLIYFGDTLNIPYGTKTKDQITALSQRIVDFLLGFDVKAIVIACNTICGNSYSALKEEYPVPFIDIIAPGAKSCVCALKNGSVGIIATQAAVNSGAYKRSLLALRPDIVIYEKACPGLVMLAEEGRLNSEEAYRTACEYIGPLAEKGVGTLLLGCTHFPLLIGPIKKAAGEGINIADPSRAAALSLKRSLIENGALAERAVPVPPDFYVSGNPEHFSKICEIALGGRFPVMNVDI